MKKRSLNILVGNAGEYYVCAELSRRGYLALITPKNNPLFDLVATTPDGTESVHIQVKTRSIHNKQGWKFGKDVTIKRDNHRLFTVLVNLLEEGLPEFYVYEYDALADTVATHFQDYLSKPKRDGNPRKDPGFRWFDNSMFSESDSARLNNWEPIERTLE